MQTTLQLEYADVQRIVEGARQDAHRRGAAVTIVLCDGGGHLLRLERLDGANAASAEVAAAKARLAALTARPSADLERAINGERPALQQLAILLSQPVAAMGGGLPLLLRGQLLGAIGVSGMTPDVDAAIATAALAALEDLGTASTP
jgi:glc operon protein GlcG